MAVDPQQNAANQVSEYSCQIHSLTQLSSKLLHLTFPGHAGNPFNFALQSKYFGVNSTF